MGTPTKVENHMTEQKDPAYLAGWNAAIDEVFEDPQDPYPPGSPESERWQIGLKDGRFEVRVWNGSE